MNTQITVARNLTINSDALEKLNTIKYAVLQQANCCCNDFHVITDIFVASQPWRERSFPKKIFQGM